MELPPLVRNFTGTVAACERSHCVKNSSALPLFSPDQIADNSGAVPSNAAPKSLTAAWSARQIPLPPSINSAGHPAFSKAKTSSDFINKQFQFRAYPPIPFLNVHLQAPLQTLPAKARARQTPLRCQARDCPPPTPLLWAHIP